MPPPSDPAHSVKAVASAAKARGRAGASFAGAISFQSVRVRIKQRTIIKDVSLEFAAGKVTCLLGPSGCGKTTILRLAAGVATPTAGRILIDGLEVAGPATFVPPEKRNVGLMFQDYALFPHLTVIENVAYGLYALSRQEARQAALSALERVGLAAMADLYPNRLSGGEQQRVALARAIVPRPQVILMDEPFSGLDQRLRDQVRNETLAIVRETHATAVLVTHDPMEAIAASDHIYLMRDGAIVQHGTPQFLYEHPADVSVARFFTASNAFSVNVKNGAVDLPVGRLATPGHSDGQALDILIAPEAIRLSDSKTGVEAYVVESHYLGGRLGLKLAFQGSETLLDAIVNVNTPIETGATQRFVIDLSGVHTFKKP